uniref:Uncharacterized protein n=1 Tax=Strombidinopsis acuminata TaxID=141414 RepID=A0A7S3RLE6_9SPIT|mmetsp:Transcript_386/g.1252  ORF Transcript_386/g.1252 Transcript_386/m.1252 type:complete len:103 (-) Transcript_386:512-820(-)|eukprot:scaffold283444_cov30-Tisochrysis_lutea.AAC.1
MPKEQRDELDIATLLDPRFKEYTFPGVAHADLEDAKESALQAMKLAWAYDWKPAPVACAAVQSQHGAPSTRVEVAAVPDLKGSVSSVFGLWPPPRPPTWHVR